MKAAVLVTVAGCWTQTPPAPVVVEPARVAPRATCVIDDHEVTPTASEVKILAEGAPFGTFDAPISRLTVTFEGDRHHARLETDEVELRAEIDLGELLVRPASDAKPYEGWLKILAAMALESNGAQLAIAVDLPTGVIPATKRVLQACDALTFEAHVPDDDEDSITGLNALTFTAGVRTPISVTPGGPAVATIFPTGDRDVVGRAIGTQGDFLKIQLVGEHSIITGWVPSANTTPGGSEYGAGFGFGRSGANRRVFVCPKRIAIYVEASRGRMLVGHYKPNASIYVDQHGKDRHVVWLGQRELEPYVLADDVDHCND